MFYISFPFWRDYSISLVDEICISVLYFYNVQICSTHSIWFGSRVLLQTTKFRDCIFWCHFEASSGIRGSFSDYLISSVTLGPGITPHDFCSRWILLLLRKQQLMSLFDIKTFVLMHCLQIDVLLFFNRLMSILEQNCFNSSLMPVHFITFQEECSM